jgi:phosphoribosylanthranilate isomerase
MKVKICGLTTLDDALAALDAGADLLGFNFYPPSPRSISIAACTALVRALRKRSSQVQLVGVFVNMPPAGVLSVLEQCELDLAQLSGDEPPEDLQRLGERAFKALRPADMPSLVAGLERYPAHPGAPAYLVDAYRSGEYGGTGRSADWSLARSLAVQVPILLAGGLRLENVAAAVVQVRPWGVDVASGIETAPGRKDASKMKAFVQAAQMARPAEEETE